MICKISVFHDSTLLKTKRLGSILFDQKMGEPANLIWLADYNLES